MVGFGATMVGESDSDSGGVTNPFVAGVESPFVMMVRGRIRGVVLGLAPVRIAEGRICSKPSARATCSMLLKYCGVLVYGRVNG